MHFNTAWLQYTGNVDDASPQSSWKQAIHPGDIENVQAELYAVQNSPHLTKVECRLKSWQGENLWFLLSLQSLPNDVGEAPLWLCTATNIQALKQTQAELETKISVQSNMLNISADCIKLIAINGTIQHMNKAGCLALGVPLDSDFGMSWVSLLPENVRDEGNAALAKARNLEPAVFAGRSKLPGRPAQYWSNMLTPVTDTDGELTSILCVSREVTGERNALEALKESEERLATAARVGGLGVWDFDISSNTLHCDDAWHSIMGRDTAVRVTSMTEFIPIIHPEDVARATEVTQTAAQLWEAKEDYSIVFRIIRPDNTIRWVRSAACLFYDTGDNPSRAIGYVTDITEVWLSELALRDENRTLCEERRSFERQSLEDPLTEIPNRRHLDKELEKICREAIALNQTFSIGMIDVDHFKAYNDRYGHPAGDDVLRKIAKALHSVASQFDLVARFGGEEFIFALPLTSHPTPFLKSLQTAIEALGIIHEGSPTGFVTISCGCLTIQASAYLTPHALIKTCDELLYEAKTKGRNRIITSFRADIAG